MKAKRKSINKDNPSRNFRMKDEEMIALAQSFLRAFRKDLRYFSAFKKQFNEAYGEELKTHIYAAKEKLAPHQHRSTRADYNSEIKQDMMGADKALQHLLKFMKKNNMEDIKSLLIKKDLPKARASLEFMANHTRSAFDLAMHYEDLLIEM
ncbi:MAG: hypothetical protein NTX03_15120, partial [Bacteroidetes bacterium]|nr:hypothetical protein [Bacteroidota bacterium]